MHYILKLSTYTKHCLYWSVFSKSSIPNFSIFFNFVLICSANCASHIFSLFLLVSKLYELSLRIREHILQIFQYCYLQQDQIVLFVPIQTFFWSVNCTILACKLCFIFNVILNLWSVLILEIFNVLDIKKSQLQFLVTFVAVFFWSVNCTNLVCISS